VAGSCELGDEPSSFITGEKKSSLSKRRSCKWLLKKELSSVDLDMSTSDSEHRQIFKGFPEAVLHIS
jgi:hypothetical protein